MVLIFQNTDVKFSRRDKSPESCETMQFVACLRIIFYVLPGCLL
eukprot:Gb_34284 [translate_table: standard]